jgi:Zn-dependent membrane protease YugP
VVYIILVLVFLLLIYAPQFWVKRILEKFNQKEEDNFPGTGGEFARHILDKLNMEGVNVEITEKGDHYDPDARCVRLTKDKFNGKTLTSITVAAHECGHAIQHAAQEPLFTFRCRIARFSIWAQRIGSFLLFSAPLVVILLRIPSVALINLIAVFLLVGFSTLLHLVTLPVELDASFNKALPILEKGYLNSTQMPAARKILKAAAWTYVSGSLAGLFNFWRWISILKR